MEENSLKNIKGIGARRAEAFQNLGILTPFDLINHLPRSYLDWSAVTPVGALEDGQTVLVAGTVCSDITVKRIKNLTLYSFYVSDGSPSEFGKADTLSVTLFNQKYTAEKIVRGKKLYLYGKVEVYGSTAEMKSPQIEEKNEGGFRAIYPLTAGLSSKIIHNAVKSLLQGNDPLEIPETLSGVIRERYALCGLKQAYFWIHFPQTREQIDAARKRLAFEELLVFQISLTMMKRRIQKQKAPALTDASGMETFETRLPFRLTDAQKRVIGEAVTDMQKPCPMSRIVQGDVGSGKTAVAAALCHYAYQNGRQSCLMVPTEILAIQHYNDLRPLLEKCGMQIALLTSGTPAKEKRNIKQRLACGEIDLLIGTQALIEQDVVFQSLALAITDEQHRFGVKQRAKLSDKGNGVSPHVLVMSATPIPRTLALILYGDMDISVIDELPAGRKKVATFLLDSGYNSRLYGFVAKQTKAGNQTYVVCPLVEGEQEDERKSVSLFAQELQTQYLPGIQVAFLHGKMKSKEKDRILTAFSQNQIQVLVSTTVIEVGVNVPNATTMIIQNAERFGLSQLHQLRGRVGRSDKKSYCFLVSDTKTETTLERLQSFCKTNDGFAISKKDLELRGPGNFFGKQQHGLPEFKIADIVGDMDLLVTAKNAAEELMRDTTWHKREENIELKHEVARFFIRYERENLSANTI